MRVARRVVLGGWLCLAAPASSLAAAEAQDAAAAIKATYLVKIGGFVEWPAAAFASASSPLVLCVVGSPAFGGLLEAAAAGQFVGQHPIEVRRFAAVTRAAGCHVLYAGGSERSAEAALAASRGEPVLTVTDLPIAAPRKGIINFVIQDNHVRFEIDARTAAENQLRISSQLLTLAVNVQR